YAQGNIGRVTIAGDLKGGEGASSGTLSCRTFKAVLIGKDLVGGAGEDSGLVEGTPDIPKLGDPVSNTLRIGGSGRGGTGNNSGSINALVKTLRIGGSVLGGTGDYSGYIGITSKSNNVTIGGDIRGGNANNSGHVDIGSLFAATFTLGGSLIAGTSGGFENNGAIRFLHNVGKLLIKGDVVGNASNPALIAAWGQAIPFDMKKAVVGKPLPFETKDVAMRSLRVLGHDQFPLSATGYEPLFDWS